MANRWTEDEDKLLVESYEKGGYDLVLVVLPNRSYESVKCRISNLYIPKRAYWNDKEDAVVKYLYSGTNIKEVAAALPQYTEKAVQHRIDKLGLRKKKYNKTIVNDNFFSSIDCIEKAYLLGYFVADGWLNGRGNEFGIVSKDCEHLRLLCRHLDYNGLLRFRKHSGCYELRIYSTHMVNDLILLGYNHQKSNTAHYPTISSELDSHFIRGVFDGDGCISRTRNGKNGKWAIDFGILGTQQLLTGISVRLPEKLTVCHKKNNLYEIGTSYDKARRILEWIYQDSESLRLDRKYERYIESQTHTGFYSTLI